MKKLHQVLGAFGRSLGKPAGFERVVRALARPENCRDMPDVLLTLDELGFIAQPSVPVGWHLFFFGDYEPELRRVFRSVLHAECVALDVGANVGWHTVLMAHLVGPNGAVLAFEPNPSVCERLRRNLALNHLKQVEVHPVALSNTEGRLKFWGPPSESPGSGDSHVVGLDHAPLADLISVEAATLDSMVERAHLSRLDLIKIDVEGFEWPVLQGAEKTLARFRPHVVFEYISEYLHRGKGSKEMIQNYFRRQGYEIFTVGRYHNESMNGGEWPVSANLWAVPLL